MNKYKANTNHTPVKLILHLSAAPQPAGWVIGWKLWTFWLCVMSYSEHTMIIQWIKFPSLRCKYSLTQFVTFRPTLISLIICLWSFCNMQHNSLLMSTFVLLLINSWGGYREYHWNVLFVKRAPLISECGNNNYNNNIIVIIIYNIWSVTV